MESSSVSSGGPHRFKELEAFCAAYAKKFREYGKSDQFPELKAIWKAEPKQYLFWYGEKPEGAGGVRWREGHPGTHPRSMYPDKQGVTIFKALASRVMETAAELLPVDSAMLLDQWGGSKWEE